MNSRPDRMIRTSAEQALDYQRLAGLYVGRVLTALDLLELVDHVEHDVMRSLAAGTKSPA